MVLVIGRALLAFDATSHYWIAVISVAVAGFAMVIIGVGEQQFLQNAVSGELRGRVMSLYGVLSHGVPAIGAFLMGTASSYVGLQWR
jgi:hypothetical protein